MTPDQRQALARETAEAVVNRCDTRPEKERVILSALEKATAEANKQAEALATDKERLEFLNSHGAYISHSRDGEVCNVWRFDEDGEQEPVEGYPQKCYYDFREAIDKARATLAAYRKEKQL